jgi:hypothetical protein
LTRPLLLNDITDWSTCNFCPDIFVPRYKKNFYINNATNDFSINTSKFYIHKKIGYVYDDLLKKVYYFNIPDSLILSKTNEEIDEVILGLIIFS